MADDGSQQRKPNFLTAVEDVKALAKVLDLRSPAVLAAIGVAAALVLALVVVMALSQTGDSNAVSDNAAVIGALVALGGVLTAQMVSIALDARSNQETQELEARRAHEAVLQRYLDHVGKLMIEQKLLQVGPDHPLSKVVRAQTLSMLAGLNPNRKRILILFIYDSGLINESNPVLSLRWANLSGVNLSEVNGQRIFLFKAALGVANLAQAKLYRADLHGSDLHGSDLSGANLREADLSGANLNGATGITNEELEQQAHSLRGATMPGRSKHP